MNIFSIKKIIILGTVLLLTGFAVLAFAHGGGYHMRGGSGYGMMNGGHMGDGYGYGMMNGYHMGGGHMWNDLSVEDQQKMQDQMNKFFSSTRELRNQYDRKRVELNQEYAKPEADQARIDTLEKELFDLSSKIEKERFEHMSGMRKLFADKAPGYHMGRGGVGGCF